MNVYFLSEDPYHLAQEGQYKQTDGQMDKNRQTIAATLRLRFAVRVNYSMHTCSSYVHFILHPLLAWNSHKPLKALRTIVNQRMFFVLWLLDSSIFSILWYIIIVRDTYTNHEDRRE